jgi:hypothetical protein
LNPERVKPDGFDPEDLPNDFRPVGLSPASARSRCHGLGRSPASRGARGRGENSPSPDFAAQGFAPRGLNPADFPANGVRAPPRASGRESLPPSNFFHGLGRSSRPSPADDLDCQGFGLPNFDPERFAPNDFPPPNFDPPGLNPPALGANGVLLVAGASGTSPAFSQRRARSPIPSPLAA